MGVADARSGGFLSCLDVHKREETSRSIRRWRTQTGGAMRVREVSSRKERIKTNLPFVGEAFPKGFAPLRIERRFYSGGTPE
jgi:hypothetical protein